MLIPTLRATLRQLFLGMVKIALYLHGSYFPREHRSVCVCYRNSGGLMDNEMSLSWCNVFSLCPTFERETVRQRWFGSTYMSAYLAT